MKTILIIDDTEDYAESLRFVLERAGFRVVFAGNGKNGLEKAVEIKPDLILMDVLMPEQDGVQTTLLIREQPALNNIPVLFLTAVTAGEHVVMSVKGQDYPAISKMADHGRILEKIRQCLEKPPASRT
ncbi:MAG: response regulator [Candidatus Omnitrophica bacterium]|nr:response regulator [Candidatus Omnitrophota bacterium]